MRNIRRQRILHQILDNLFHPAIEARIQRRSNIRRMVPVDRQLIGDSIRILDRGLRFLRVEVLIELRDVLGAVPVQELGEAAGERRVLEDDVEVVDGEEADGERFEVGLRYGGRWGFEVVGGVVFEAGAEGGGGFSVVVVCVGCFVRVVEDEGRGGGCWAREFVVFWRGPKSRREWLAVHWDSCVAV